MDIHKEFVHFLADLKGYVQIGAKSGKLGHSGPADKKKQPAASPH